MENLKKIIDNQEKINELTEKYENCTRKLLSCSVDEIPGFVDKREVLLKKIGALDNEILDLCEENSQEYLAYKNICDRSELPDELKEVFDLRQQFNSSAARIQDMEPEIKERIAIERDRLLEKIKKNNSGQNAKAAKYFNAGLSQGKNIYFPENKKRI